MKPPKRFNACWDSLDARVWTTSARLSPIRKTHPLKLLFGAVTVPTACYLVAYAGLGFPPAAFSFDVIAAMFVLTLVVGVPVFASFFLHGVFFTTITIFPGEGVVRKSWGPYHLRLWRRWISVGDGPWRILSAEIRVESAALHDAMSCMRSGSPMAMISGMQQLSTADETLSAADCPVWGLVCGGGASSLRAIAWFRDLSDAQAAQHAIIQAGGIAIPSEIGHDTVAPSVVAEPSSESDERLDTAQC